MWIIPLIFFIVFLFFMRGMFGRGPSGGGNSSQPESAQEILDKRFARGEISKEEYQERKKALGNGNS